MAEGGRRRRRDLARRHAARGHARNDIRARRSSNAGRRQQGRERGMAHALRGSRQAAFVVGDRGEARRVRRRDVSRAAGTVVTTHRATRTADGLPPRRTKIWRRQAPMTCPLTAREGRRCPLRCIRHPEADGQETTHPSHPDGPTGETEAGRKQNGRFEQNWPTKWTAFKPPNRPPRPPMAVCENRRSMGNRRQASMGRLTAAVLRRSPGSIGKAPPQDW